MTGVQTCALPIYAIEACQQYDKCDKAIHVMAVAQQDFFVSVRNTSEPVVIINGSIPSTRTFALIALQNLSFSVFFLLIRKYTNGYHAATYSKCLFCSILLEVVLLASISYVFRTGLALLFLTIVSDITILYIAPVNNKSIHWSTNEFKAAKIAVRWLLLILNIFAILLVGTQIAPSILQGLVAALTADAITLSISRCQN